MRRFYQAAMGSKSLNTFIVDEKCEGTGTPAGWTNASGSPNWDYTAVPLEAAQSLYLASNAAIVRARIDWTDLTEVWIYFLWRFTNGTVPGAGAVAFGGLSANGSAATTIPLTLSSASRLAFSASPTATVTVDTTYHIWLHYIQGTGANATVDIGFSTTGVRPTSGTGFAQTTIGAQTTLAGRLWLGPSGTTLLCDTIFDKIRVAATQIGDNGEF